MIKIGDIVKSICVIDHADSDNIRVALGVVGIVLDTDDDHLLVRFPGHGTTWVEYSDDWSEWEVESTNNAINYPERYVHDLFGNAPDPEAL